MAERDRNGQALFIRSPGGQRGSGRVRGGSQEGQRWGRELTRVLPKSAGNERATSSSVHLSSASAAPLTFQGFLVICPRGLKQHKLHQNKTARMEPKDLLTSRLKKINQLLVQSCVQEDGEIKCRFSFKRQVRWAPVCFQRNQTPVIETIIQSGPQKNKNGPKHGFRYHPLKRSHTRGGC